MQVHELVDVPVGAHGVPSPVGADRRGHDQPADAGRAQPSEHGSGRDPGGEAVVHQDDVTALDGNRLGHRPVAAESAPRLGELHSASRGQVGGCQPGPGQGDPVVAGRSVRGHRAHSALGTTGFGDLPRHGDVQPGPERVGHPGRHRHAAPGQSHHHRVAPRLRPEEGPEPLTGVGPVGEHGSVRLTHADGYPPRRGDERHLVRSGWTRVPFVQGPPAGSSPFHAAAPRNPVRPARGRAARAAGSCP